MIGSNQINFQEECLLLEWLRRCMLDAFDNWKANPADIVWEVVFIGMCRAVYRQADQMIP